MVKDRMIEVFDDMYALNVRDPKSRIFDYIENNEKQLFIEEPKH